MTVVGSATVTVGPDATGFGAKTEAAVRKALQGVQAQIDLTLDEAGLRQKIGAAVAAAGAGQDAEIDLDVNTSSFQEKVRRAAAVVNDVDIGADFDDEGLRRDVNRAVRLASQDVEIGVDSGGGRSGGDADRVGAAAGGIFGRAVLRSAARVLAAGGLAQLFTAAAAGATAIGSALISATGAAGSLLATAASMPAVFSAAAQAAASIAFAFGGIGGALKAFGAMEKAVGKAAAGGGDSGTAARNSERAIRDATRGVADAERSMADAVEAAVERSEDALQNFEDAQRDAADVAETAARRVADAEENLADAHRRVQSAQEDLTQARRDAVAEIANLRDSVESLSLAEEDAALRVAEAEQRLREGRQGTSTHPVLGEDVTKVNLADRQRAERDALNLRRAQLSLVEATKRRAEAQEKLNKAEADGVDGNEKVIDATARLEDARRREADAVEDYARTQRDAARSITDANQRVIDSQEEVGKAQRDLARAQTDGAERVALAQERLADAVEDASLRAEKGVAGVAGATDAYEAALARLSPHSRRFVEFLVSLQPLLRRVQATAAAGLFPGLEQAIRTVLPLVDDMEPIIGATAKAVADLAVEGANLIASPAFRGDLVTIGRRNIDIITGLGRAAISGGNSLRHITIAAGPLTQHLVDLTQQFALMVEQALALGRADGSLEAFFGRVSARVDRLIVTLGFFGTGLFRVFREATPAGDKLFDSLARIGARLDIITDRASKDGSLRKFFDDALGPMSAFSALLSDVVRGLVGIGRENFGTFTVFTEQLRTELLPALLEVLGAIDTDFLSALVSLTTGFVNLFGALLSGNPTLTFLVEVLGDMASGISDLLTDIPILSSLLQGLVTIFGGLAVVGAVAALKNFASTAFGVERALMTMTGTVKVAKEGTDQLEFSATRTGKAYETAGRLIGRAFLIGAIVLAAKQALDLLAPSADKAAQAVLRSADAGKEFERQFEKVSNPGFWDRLALSAKSFLSNPVDHTFRSLTFQTSKVREELERFTQKDFFKIIADQGVAGGTRVIDSLKAQGRETGEFERIIEELILETAKNGVAQEEVNKKIADQTKALRTNNDKLKEWSDRIRKSADNALSLSGATINMEQAFDDLTAAVKEDTTAFNIREETGRKAQAGLDRYVTSIQDSIDKLKVSAEAGYLDADAKKLILENLEKLAQSGFPGAETAANRLRSELEAIRPNYDTALYLDTRQGIEALRAFWREWDESAAARRSLAEGNASRGGGGVPPGVYAGAMEFGGRVMRNAAYIVGEKRPELFIPDQDGVILPQVPDIADPKTLSAALGANLGPSIGSFDIEGLIAAMRDLEDSLTEQLGSFTTTVRPGDAARDTTPEQPVVVNEFDYDAMARALDKLGSRTVTINTEVTAALPAEVGIDTARRLRNVVYLEMGD